MSGRRRMRGSAPRWLCSAAAACLLAACAPMMHGGSGAVVTLRDAEGSTVGLAMLSPAAGGVRVVVQVSGLAPGSYGVRMDRGGSCTAAAADGGGSHPVPTGGVPAPQRPGGASTVDLPALVVQPDGRGVLSTIARGVTLAPARASSLRGPGGTALLIHAAAAARPGSPPTGAEARTVCGTIAPA